VVPGEKQALAGTELELFIEQNSGLCTADYHAKHSATKVVLLWEGKRSF
jgi:hypothetical protein